MSTPGQGDLIDLTVRHQDGTKVLFRIKRSTQLKKLMSAYCDLQSLDIPDFAFFWVDDRTRVRRLVEHMTPNELEMEDGDEIDALLRQPRRAR